MILVTNERTTLVDENKVEKKFINPTDEGFEPFKLSKPLKVTSDAYIYNKETGDLVAHLRAGQMIDGVGEVLKPKPRERIKPTPVKE